MKSPKETLTVSAGLGIQIERLILAVTSSRPSINSEQEAIVRFFCRLHKIMLQCLDVQSHSKPLRCALRRA